MINHKVIRPLVAVTIGLVLALYSYQRITDPEPGLQRASEEAIVMLARDILQSYVSPVNVIEIVDAVSPASKVGKSYIYPADDGWELSGHYRRDENDRWHPYLMSLNEDAGLKSLAVQDGNDRLIGMSAQDPKFSAVPP
jgi:Ni,Fe-hydrogenase maturation factor